MTGFSWPAGVMTALVTPLRDDGVDTAGLRDLIDRQIDEGISGLVICGGTGEFGALSFEERRLVAAESVAASGGRVPVIVQTGTLATRDAVALSRHAESVGASALMVASPFGEAITWEERFHFYEVVTAQVSIPVMIYNTPPSGLLLFDQIRELATLPNVSAVKDSSGSPELMGDLTDWAAGSDFGVYVGLDSLMFDAIGGGARGAVFGAANLIPGPLSAVATSLRTNGMTPESRVLWRDHLRPFLRFVEQSTNYVSLCKAGLALLGLPGGDVREPFLASCQHDIDELGRRLSEIEQAWAGSPLAAARPVAGVTA